jgi:hypothetical protein
MPFSRILGSITVVWMLTMSPVFCACAQEQASKATTSQSREETVSLQSTIDKFQEALLKRDAEKLLGLIGREGLELGPDPQNVPFGEIEQDLRNRGPIYCAFFDGSCLRENDLRERTRNGTPAREPPLLSVAEHISGTPLETRIQQPDPGSALVRFYRLDLSDRRVMEFRLELRHNKWVITEFPTW